MIKNAFILLFIIINLFVFTEDLLKTPDDPSKILIDDYIIDKSRPTEFIELSESGYNKNVVVPYYITSEQLTEDIKILKYILNDGYSGKDYWSKNGVDFELMYKNLEDLANAKNNEVSVSSIESILAGSLKDIVDASFMIYGRKVNGFNKRKEVYFADILIEKRDNNYFVIKSKQKDIKEGMKFDDSKDLLFKTLSPKVKEHFLIGNLSYEVIKTLNIKFDNKKFNLKLHTCKVNEAYFKDDKVYYVDKKEDIPIIQATTFEEKYKKELIEFINYGKELKNSSYFILNLYNNSGGNSYYPMQFFKNINDSEINNQGIYAEIISPVTLQGQIHRDQSYKNTSPQWQNMMKRVNDFMVDQKKNTRYYWNIENLLNINNKTGNYNGTAVVLINRNSGGLAINYPRCLKNSIFIGENSASSGSFRDVCMYILPNSKIKFQLPFKLFLFKDSYEGVGYVPDYWLDSKNPINEIINWIKNPEDYIFEL